MSSVTVFRRPMRPSPIGRQIDQLQNNMRQMFQNPFSDKLFANVSPLPVMPAVDIAETEEEVTMSAELPGVQQKDVHLELDGDTLILRGEKQEERKEESPDRLYYLEERSYGSFQRAFTLPPSVDRDRIAATFENGVLKLSMPKKAGATAATREIPINAKG